jgi:hypothetical protein
MASPVSVPNTFTAATDAVAAEVNANFTSLVDYINNNMVHSDGTVNITGTQSVNNLTVTGTLTGNAATASKWLTARTLTVDGDMTGSVSIDGSTDVALTLSAALEVADIPDLPGAKITSGTVDKDYIDTDIARKSEVYGYENDNTGFKISASTGSGTPTGGSNGDIHIYYTA